MKAVVKLEKGEGHVEYTDVQEPVCRPGCVKLEVKFSGICGTDLHVFHDTFTYYPPVILGHEFGGVITEVGEGVTKVKPGSRVAVLGSTMIQCGKCEFCRAGQYMFCKNRRGMGHGTNGSFTRFVVVREDQVYPIPDAMPMEYAALYEPFGTAVQAVEEITPFGPGDVVLVSGPGPIGLMCAALAAANGCRVVVAGAGGDGLRLGIAKQLGCDFTVDVTQQPLQPFIEELTHGRGVDIAIESAGAAASARACLAALRPLGRYIQVGINGHEVTLPFDTVLYKMLTVYGAIGHSLSTWDRIVRIMEQGKVDLSPLITHKMPLSQWREAFDLCERKETCKVLLYADEGVDA
jgi:L-iditol 2-dehydrogenase